MAVVVLSYLFYRPFDAWWYLRFLLPMWPVMMLLTAASAGRARAALAAAGLSGRDCGRRGAWLAWHGVRPPPIDSRSISGAASAATSTWGVSWPPIPSPAPCSSACSTAGRCGSTPGRLTLRYDLLDPAWLDRTVEHLRSIGRRPYFVLDDGEVEVFKQRFGRTNRLGALDWPPIATLGIDCRDLRSDRPETRHVAAGDREDADAVAAAGSATRLRCARPSARRRRAELIAPTPLFRTR